MSDIGGVGNFGNDPFLSALQRQQQGDDLLQQQQRALDAAARRGRETQALSDNLERGLGRREGLDGESLLLSQVAGETADIDASVSRPFQQNNEDRTENSQRQESDRVEISREARERLSQETAAPSPGEEVGPERDDPLLIDTAQEIQEVELSEPLDRGNNETAAGRELGQVLDQFS